MANYRYEVDVSAGYGERHGRSWRMETDARDTFGAVMEATRRLRDQAGLPDKAVADGFRPARFAWYQVGEVHFVVL